MGIVHSHGDESKKNVIYATSKFPIMPLTCPEKICITFVFLFSWVLQPSQEKLKKVLMQNFGGQIWCIMGYVEVAYSRKRDFLLFIRHFHISHNTPCLPPILFHNRCTFFPLCITVVPREIKDCLCKTRSIMEGVKMASSPF